MFDCISPRDGCSSQWYAKSHKFRIWSYAQSIISVWWTLIGTIILVVTLLVKSPVKVRVRVIDDAQMS